MCHERDQEKHEKNEEQQLRHTRSRQGYASETENPGDDGDNQEHYRPIKHFCLLSKLTPSKLTPPLPVS
jgi:hypothetical protein